MRFDDLNSVGEPYTENYFRQLVVAIEAGRSFDRRVGQVRIPEGFRPNHQFNSRRAVGSACRNERALWGRLLTIPGLHDNLACDFSALKLDHRRAEHPGSIGIRTALREGETLAYGDAAFDLLPSKLRGLLGGLSRSIT